MSVEERREARRRRILENSENRLKKITTLSTTENVLNGHANLIKDEQEKITLTQFPEWTVPKCNVEEIAPTVSKHQQIYNYEPIHLNSKLHSKKVEYYEIKFSYITITHMILSQIVLMLFYYNLGFLFGNSIVVPFLFSIIPELYASEEQYDSIHMFVLLMLGFSQDKAKQISRCTKLASLTVKWFCVYIFCFTCSYSIIMHFNFNVKHNSIT